MKLTTNNFVNYVIEKESQLYNLMLKCEEDFGEDASETLRVRSSWNSYFDIVREFDLEDKLTR